MVMEDVGDLDLDDVDSSASATPMNRSMSSATGGFGRAGLQGVS